MGHKKKCLRMIVVTVVLTVAAFLSNWLGMQAPTFTVGRALPLFAYLGFAAALPVWMCYCLWSAISRRAAGEWLSVVAALLAIFLLFVWPFTFCYGRLNDSLFRQEREVVIDLWRDGALMQTSAEGWMLPQGMRDVAWNQKLWVNRDTFTFRVYNDLLRNVDLLYSPKERPLRAGEQLVSLGDGWYWRVDGY